MSDTVAVAKELVGLLTSAVGDVTFRICTPSIAPLALVMLEVEYGSMADGDEDLAQLRALPELASLMERLNQLTEPGGAIEIWRLE